MTKEYFYFARSTSRKVPCEFLKVDYFGNENTVGLGIRDRILVFED
ncbi:MAG: hypothetical protein M3033_01080 [Acidobacteriota bacterium]|nr:hypothetical protein [Acidobacteriota bacterium]